MSKHVGRKYIIKTSCAFVGVVINILKKMHGVTHRDLEVNFIVTQMTVYKIRGQH